MNQIFWSGYSGMCYLPGTSRRSASHRTGDPVGVQIVGPQYGDRTCLQFARLLEKEYQAFVPPPDYPVVHTAPTSLSPQAGGGLGRGVGSPHKQDFRINT